MLFTCEMMPTISETYKDVQKLVYSISYSNSCSDTKG